MATHLAKLKGKQRDFEIARDLGLLTEKLRVKAKPKVKETDLD